jgi:hypothetical protein
VVGAEPAIWFQAEKVKANRNIDFGRTNPNPVVLRKSRRFTERTQIKFARAGAQRRPSIGPALFGDREIDLSLDRAFAISTMKLH